MRHRKRGRKFGREKNVRNALLRSLARSLILRGRIKTTEAKAKEIRPAVERLVTKGKSNTVASSREIFKRIPDKAVVKKLQSGLGPKYLDRKGGYTRIIRIGRRVSDQASMVYIEFV